MTDFIVALVERPFHTVRGLPSCVENAVILSRLGGSLGVVALMLVAGSCDGGPTPAARTMEFDRQLADTLVQRQVAFGPRVPGTTAHAEALAWMHDGSRRSTGLDDDISGDACRRHRADAVHACNSGERNALANKRLGQLPARGDVTRIGDCPLGHAASGRESDRCRRPR
jgi:hypothetical protein